MRPFTTFAINNIPNLKPVVKSKSVLEEWNEFFEPYRKIPSKAIVENTNSETIQSRVSSSKIVSEAYVDALYRVGLSKDARRHEKCGKPMVLYCSNCGHQETVKYACGLRTCPVCSKKMSAYYVSKFWKAMMDLPTKKNGYRFRTITLTTPFEIDRENVRTVRAWAGKFCRAITLEGEGAIFGLEAGEEGHKLHVHVLHYGRFKLFSELLKLWSEISGGTCKVVYVEGVKEYSKAFTLRKSLKETIKYATKVTSMDENELANLEWSLKGTRRISTYGIFYRLYRWVKAEKKSFVRSCPVCGNTKWLAWENFKFLMADPVERKARKIRNKRKGANNDGSS